MKQKLDWGFVARNFIFFLLAVIVGTLSHELGHYVAAKLLGIKASIHYEYTRFLSSGNPKYYILLTLGGIFSTIIIGTFGFIMLLRQQCPSTLNLKNHIYIILALFWSRELSFVVGGIYYTFFKKPPYFRGDEGKVDGHFNLYNAQRQSFLVQ